MSKGWNGKGNQTNKLMGFSIKTLMAAISSAPKAPSTARWSQDRVTLITVAIASAPFLTTGRCSPAPTARKGVSFGCNVAYGGEILDAEHTEIGDGRGAALIFLGLQFA